MSDLKATYDWWKSEAQIQKQHEQAAIQKATSTLNLLQTCKPWQALAIFRSLGFKHKDLETAITLWMKETGQVLEYAKDVETGEIYPIGNSTPPTTPKLFDEKKIEFKGLDLGPYPMAGKVGYMVMHPKTKEAYEGLLTYPPPPLWFDEGDKPVTDDLIDSLLYAGASKILTKEETAKLLNLQKEQAVIAEKLAILKELSKPVKVYHKSDKDDWGTPWDFYLWLHAKFHFTLDVCATAKNAKCETFLTPEMDGTAIDWWGKVWMNPPYTKASTWVDEMIAATKTGEIELGVVLVAARTDTQWFWKAFNVAREVWFLKGRLKFEGAEHGAPFPSCVMVFDPEYQVVDKILKLNLGPSVYMVDWKKDLFFPAK